MRKIDTNYRNSKSVKNALVNRDDLERVIQLIKSKGCILEIQDEEHTFEDIQDVIDNKGLAPKYLRLRIRKEDKEAYLSSFYITIDNREINLLSHGDETLSFLVSEIYLILSKKETTLIKLTQPPGLAFIGAISFIVAKYLSDEGKSGTLSDVFAWASILGLVGAPLSFIYYNYLFSPINLYRSHESSFFKRNQEKIILLVVGAVFSSVVQFLFKFLKEGN